MLCEKFMTSLIVKYDWNNSGTIKGTDYGFFFQQEWCIPTTIKILQRESSFTIYPNLPDLKLDLLWITFVFSVRVMQSHHHQAIDVWVPLPYISKHVRFEVSFNTDRLWELNRWLVFSVPERSYPTTIKVLRKKQFLYQISPNIPDLKLVLLQSVSGN